MINNNYNRRSRYHDYRKPFIYHIIIKKGNNDLSFGYLRGNADIPPGNRGAAYVFLSSLGHAIANGMGLFVHDFPIFKIFRNCIMPDHIHLIIYKNEWTHYHLDWYIERLKEIIIDLYNFANQSSFEKEHIFLHGYTDKPLYDNLNLNNWFVYLNENPHRRLMRLQYPDFFKRNRSFRVGEMNLEIYGNPFLLRNPDKMAVRIRRKFSTEERRRFTMRALEQGARSTILVSPFISRDEKEIFNEAEKQGAKFIIITHEKFGELYKPHKHYFDLCAEGRLLIISLGMNALTPLTYPIACKMNDLAETIASPTFDTKLPSV